ncbi:MAG: hypothetical protein KDA41_18495, partial [Planctomycetales bacterium]|nr:hypothetical protein [Planctomycetales bacterium]
MKNGAEKNVSFEANFFPPNDAHLGAPRRATRGKLQAAARVGVPLQRGQILRKAITRRRLAANN